MPRKSKLLTQSGLLLLTILALASSLSACGSSTSQRTATKPAFNPPPPKPKPKIKGVLVSSSGCQAPEGSKRLRQFSKSIHKSDAVMTWAKDGYGGRIWACSSNVGRVYMIGSAAWVRDEIAEDAEAQSPDWIIQGAYPERIDFDLAQNYGGEGESIYVEFSANLRTGKVRRVGGGYSGPS